MNETLQRIYSLLEPSLKKYVAIIEVGPLMSQHRYAEYGSAISSLAKAFTTNDIAEGQERKLAGLLLIKAGGNVQGIRDALQYL